MFHRAYFCANIDNKIDIYLARYGDTLISLKDRSRLANGLKADVFVSLHCNASPNTSSGMEVYVHNVKKEEVHFKRAIVLRLSILNESTHRLGFKKRGVRFANFQVLRETVDCCPSLLLELGFLSNWDEEVYLEEVANKTVLAGLLYNTLIISNNDQIIH